jgi:hypothetical protein
MTFFYQAFPLVKKIQINNERLETLKMIIEMISADPVLTVP